MTAHRGDDARWRSRRRTLSTLIAVCLLLATPAAGAGGQTPLLEVSLRGTPFTPDGDGSRDDVRLVVDLSRRARLWVVVVDFDGRVIRNLRDGAWKDPGTLIVRWDGQDATGADAPNGSYRFLVDATDGSVADNAERRVTRARWAIYGAAPRAITIAIDPGHGGSYTGAVAPDGTRESDLNLDIALRLREMLEGARVRVVMTRTTDADVNVPAWDRNGDGEVGYRDELAARPDVANPARADLFLSIHNNIANDPRVGGPSTFYWRERPFGQASLRFAQLVQQEVVRKLRRYRTADWTPYDHGVLRYDYYVLKSYDPAGGVPRPTLMPGVLAESLFVSHPTELALLQRPDVRGAIAEAYYDAIARYLAVRPAAVGYHAASGPDAIGITESATYDLRVRNRGTETGEGWTLQVSAAPAVPLYDGSTDPGDAWALLRLPPLAPGARESVSIEVSVPPADADWLVKFDILIPDGGALSTAGSPALQLPLRVGAGAPPSP